MISHFRVAAVFTVAALASPAHAELQLPRSEIEALMADNAICYARPAGGCYSIEIIEDVGGETVDVTYTMQEADRRFIVRERASWSGDFICVSRDTLGVQRAWILQRNAHTFMFDMSNASLLLPQPLSHLKQFLQDSRSADYCYGLFADDDGLGGLRGVIADQDASRGASVILIPFSELFVSLR